MCVIINKEKYHLELYIAQNWQGMRGGHFKTNFVNEQFSLCAASSVVIYTTMYQSGTWLLSILWTVVCTQYFLAIGWLSVGYVPKSIHFKTVIFIKVLLTLWCQHISQCFEVNDSAIWLLRCRPQNALHYYQQKDWIRKEGITMQSEAVTVHYVWRQNVCRPSHESVRPQWHPKLQNLC